MRQQEFKKALISIICISLSLQTSIAFGEKHNAETLTQLILKQDGVNPENKTIPDTNTKNLVDSQKIDEVVREAVESDNVVEVVIEEEPVETIESIKVEETEKTLIVDDGKFNYIKHNDLRDAAKYDKYLPGTSNYLLKKLQENPSLFAGVEVGFYRKGNGDNIISGMGPIGEYRTGDKGKQYFKVLNDRSERRKNTILSAWYERVVDVTKEDKVFDIDLMLFVHSESKGYFFREINISVDWNKNGEKNAEVLLNKVLREVPLSETNFELRVEVATQKIIMHDTKNGIVKVSPVTLGAIDARYEIDGTVNSMTLLLPGKKGQYKDFSFKDTVIMKRTFWHNGGNQNTASRTFPAYYKGRPFIGLIDRSLIPELQKDERDNYVMVSANEVNYRKGYRHIGFHYQIEDNGLVRGYESHGCLRLQDHDLYVLDTILNAGPKDYIQVQVSIKLDDNFDKWNSVYKRQKTYDKVAYSSSPNSPAQVLCKNKSPYDVRFFGQYHTIGDSDCLSKTYQTEDSIDNVVAYLTGKSSVYPTILYRGAMEHVSIANRINFLRDNQAYIPYLRPNLYNYDDLSQTEQIKLVDEIKDVQSGILSIDTNTQQSEQVAPDQFVITDNVEPVNDNYTNYNGLTVWPQVRRHKGQYNRLCLGKQIGWERNTNNTDYRRGRTKACIKWYNKSLK